MDAEQVKALVHKYAECPRESIDWGIEERRAAFAAIDAMQAQIDKLRSALDLIVKRMQMNIDDGSKLDKTTMELLVNRAQAALSEESKGTT